MTAVFIVISILLQIGLPVVLGFWLVRRYGSSWTLFLVSGAAFMIIDVVRSYLLQAVTGLDFYRTIIAPVAIYSILLITFATGLLQQAVRWVIFRFMRDRTREVGGALVMGAGFGGIELIMLYGTEALVSFIFAIQISSSGGQGLPEMAPEQLNSLLASVQQYWARPFYQPLLEALPSLAELVTQVALALITWVAVRRGNWLWHAAAVLWFTSIGAMGNLAVLWYRSSSPDGYVNSLEGALALLCFLGLGVASGAVIWFIMTRVRPMVEQAVEPARPAPAVPVIDAPKEPEEAPKVNKTTKPVKPVKLK